MNSSISSAQAAIEQINDQPNPTMGWMGGIMAILVSAVIWGLLSALLSFFINGILVIDHYYVVTA